MKTVLETIMDCSSIFYKGLIAAICFQVNVQLAAVMTVAYLINFGASLYYVHIKMQEDKQFLEAVREAIEKTVNENEKS